MFNLKSIDEELVAALIHCTLLHQPPSSVHSFFAWWLEPTRRHYGNNHSFCMLVRDNNYVLPIGVALLSAVRVMNQ